MSGYEEYANAHISIPKIEIILSEPEPFIRNEIYFINWTAYIDNCPRFNTFASSGDLNEKFLQPYIRFKNAIAVKKTK